MSESAPSSDDHLARGTEGPNTFRMQIHSAKLIFFKDEDPFDFRKVRKIAQYSPVSFNVFIDS